MGAALVAGHGQSGEREDGDRLRARLRFEVGGGREAVLDRHGEVHQDQVGKLARRDLDACRAILGEQDAMAETLDAALTALVGGPAPPAVATAESVAPPPATGSAAVSMQSLAQPANDYFERARAARSERRRVGIAAAGGR